MQLNYYSDLKKNRDSGTSFDMHKLETSFSRRVNIVSLRKRNFSALDIGYIIQSLYTWWPSMRLRKFCLLLAY